MVVPALCPYLPNGCVYIEGRNPSFFAVDKELKRIYIDMDGVLVDFQSGIDRLTKEEYENMSSQILAFFYPTKQNPEWTG